MLYKLFVLTIVTWSYICLLRIINIYLKPYNCVQIKDYSLLIIDLK